MGVTDLHRGEYQQQAPISFVMNGVITVITPTNDRNKNGLTAWGHFTYFTLRITPIMIGWGPELVGELLCYRLVFREIPWTQKTDEDMSKNEPVDFFCEDLDLQLFDAWKK